MSRTLLSLALIVLLTGCQGGVNPAGTQKNGDTQTTSQSAGATINLSMKPVPEARVQSYRTQSVSQTISDFTPDSYLKKINRIQLMTGDVKPGSGDPNSQNNQPITIYTGQDPLDLAGDAASLSAVINQMAVPVATGTYTAIAVELGSGSTIKGQAVVDGKTYYTRTSTASDTTQGPAEPFTMPGPGEGGLPPQIIKFAKPLVINEGDNVTLSLLYDITGSWKFGTVETGWQQYSNGSYVSNKYFPIFAFIGQAPKPEVYEISIEDPQHLVEHSSEWHYRMVLFAAPDNGEIMGMQALGLIDAGFSYPSFEPGNFVDTWKAPIQNADGTYQLFGLNDMDPDKIPQWEVPAFRRATHDGTCKYYSYGGTMPVTNQQVSLTYHCVKKE